MGNSINPSFLPLYFLSILGELNFNGLREKTAELHYFFPSPLPIKHTFFNFYF